MEPELGFGSQFETGLMLVERIYLAHPGQAFRLQR
uniref:Uncharacterized protein n=1 Tax=mine drainage metagenome TaxID=410659 RepID=E6QKF7_9ZZZZ